MAKRKYGTDSPFEMKEPTKEDFKCTRVLVEMLKERKMYEDEARSQQREEVLGRLNDIVQNWAKEISLQCGLPEEVAAEQQAKIFTFGSYRLGVHGPGSDIDTLCVVPNHITRHHFFKDLVRLLQEEKDVAELAPVEDAFVPVIKFSFDTVDIDLVLAQLKIAIIPDEWDLEDSNVLRNLDFKSLRSLNGCRDTDSILKLVPSIDNFRTILRFIKLWAKKRAVYSNSFGYLGGISWAILTARICQAYPKAVAGLLLQKFFRFYDFWRWPAPIRLTETIKDPALGLEVWDPTVNPKQRMELAPIITPAYPSMNSTYNINHSTLRVLQSEFKRGKSILEGINKKNISEEDIKKIWESLLADNDFFLNHAHYLQIKLNSPDEDTSKSLHGLVESRMRHLVMRLESPQIVVTPHPYSVKHPEKFTESFFLGLKFVIERDKDGKKQKRQINLGDAITFFQSKIDGNPSKKPDMKYEILHVKAENLPEFVFKDERRPQKKKKKRKKKVSAQSSKVKKKKVEEDKKDATSQ
mmetsp:Transcript_20401/g.30526  ORF Transcript_20401/g.30526 Transcript_20401/m.30526 type:complete len:524 (+) Transcript_20401:48-1619(+)